MRPWLRVDAQATACRLQSQSGGSRLSPSERPRQLGRVGLRRELGRCDCPSSDEAALAKLAVRLRCAPGIAERT